MGAGLRAIRQKTSLVFTNRFSEANYRIIFCEKIMPEKLRRIFWTQGRARKLHFLAGPLKVSVTFGTVRRKLTDGKLEGLSSDFSCCEIYREND